MRASAGHAASVTRVVDSLAAAGFLRHSISGWNLNVPLKRVHGLIADRVTDAIRAALDGFGPEELRLLQGAASVGWKFDTDAVAQLLGVDHPAALRHGFDVLATHLPIFERTAPPPGRGPIRGHRFPLHPPSVVRRSPGPIHAAQRCNGRPYRFLTTIKLLFVRSPAEQ